MSYKHYLIVARNKSLDVFKHMSKPESNPHLDKWGWEVIDEGCDLYEDAVNILSEYQLAIPSHTIRIRILK